jgi:hypothetical protein
MLSWLTPALSILGVLGWYNWARFGSPFEFGFRFLTGPVDYLRLPNFGLIYLPDRVWENVFMPFHVSDVFPFVYPSVRLLPGVYNDRIGWGEPATGFIPSYPLLMVSVGWFYNVRRLKDPAQRQRLVFYGTCVSGAFCVIMVTLLIFYSVVFRYLMEITTPLYLLTALSLMARLERGPMARWEWAILGMIAAITLYVGMGYSLMGSYFYLWGDYLQQFHLTPHFF